MVPVITAVTSALILHEKMTKAMICGIFLTLLGLFLSEDRRKKERKIRMDTERNLPLLR